MKEAQSIEEADWENLAKFSEENILFFRGIGEELVDGVSIRVLLQAKMGK